MISTYNWPVIGLKAPGDAEPQVVVPEGGVALAAVGGTEVPRSVEPGTAPVDAPGATTFYTCRSVCWGSVVVIIPTIFHPFPYVAVHIMDTELIFLL